MDRDLAERFLTDQFPLRYRALLPPVLRNARAAAAALAKQEPILQVQSAKDNHGRLVSWATDLAIEKLINSNRWPVDYKWRWFAQPTGKYLEVRFSHSLMSISQVIDPTTQPRDVRFRQNARLSNQRSFDFPDVENITLSAGLPGFILVHGRVECDDMESEFAHVGVPHPDHKRDWIYKTRNIMDMPQEVETDLAPVEQTDVDAILTIKEEIDRWQRDNGND